jgi:sulfite exporter TauE/SafE
MGLANGLLPCGILYAALATSVALGAVAKSLVFMTGFGLGTVPVLLGVTISATSLPLPWRRRLRLAGPAVMIAAGCLLIARGVLPAGSAHHHESAILFHQH